LLKLTKYILQNELEKKSGARWPAGKLKIGLQNIKNLKL